uniref:Protein-tyrosine phosphatase n=1 Tax=Angiostrongylus cantonensis TaxID=6313 RepID=A0A158PAD0_ANGCA
MGRVPGYAIDRLDLKFLSNLDKDEENKKDKGREKKRDGRASTIDDEKPKGSKQTQRRRSRNQTHPKHMLNRTIEGAVGRTDAKKFQVQVFVEETLKKGVQGLITEFKAMRRTNDFTHMREFVRQNSEGRNRYKNVGCLDNARVVIGIGNVRYIHTNYVSTPFNSKRFICKEAPLPKTCADFWHMVVQERCSAILMLCKFTKKFAFPFSTRVQVQMTQLDVAVPGQPVHTCTHYPWLDWPDRGVPEADLVSVALLDRSIVLIQHALEILQTNERLLEISAYLLELRKQRNNSVQVADCTVTLFEFKENFACVTENQYLYIHQVLLLHLKQAKYLDDSIVKVFVEETLRKGVRGLIAEFKSMKRVNDFTKMTEFVAQNRQGRNRYKDVGCLDNDRVIIRIGPVSYIHANYVSSPTLQKRFICTQAPLPKTCADFWYMVVQEKSVAILMLCNFVEQNANKCAEYFPLDEDKPSSFEGRFIKLSSNNYQTVWRVGSKTYDFLTDLIHLTFPFPFETRVRIMVRTLEVSVSGQPLHTCLHYHWQDWPDRGVPEADLAPIVLLSKLKENTAPIIVHCSAGIGRTGSIVLIQHAMELLHLPAPLLEISTYLMELRKQRNNSIQDGQQKYSTQYAQIQSIYNVYIT